MASKLYPIRASQRPISTEDDKGQYKSRSPPDEEPEKKSNATDPEMRSPVTDCDGYQLTPALKIRERC